MVFSMVQRCSVLVFRCIEDTDNRINREADEADSMSKPVGDPPELEEIRSMAESYFTKHSYGPMNAELVSDGHIVVTSETYPVQFELEIEGDMDKIHYRVYETPQPEGDTLTENTKHCDRSFNPNLSWDRELGSLLMSISGSINGAINRDNLQKAGD